MESLGMIALTVSECIWGQTDKQTDFLLYNISILVYNIIIYHAEWVCVTVVT